MELLAFQCLKESLIEYSYLLTNSTTISVNPSDLGDVPQAVVKELNKRILM